MVNVINNEDNKKSLDDAQQKDLERSQDTYINKKQPLPPKTAEFFLPFLAELEILESFEAILFFF